MCRNLGDGTRSVPAALLIQKVMLAQQVSHDAAPGAERVMRVVETLAVNSIAGVTAATIQSLSCLCIVHDARKQLIGPFDFRVIN